MILKPTRRCKIVLQPILFAFVSIACAVLLLGLPGGLPVHAQVGPDFCNNLTDKACIELFTAPEVNIEKITSLTEQAVFTNPVIVITLIVPSDRVNKPQVRLHLPRWTDHIVRIKNVADSGNKKPQFCELIIAGVAVKQANRQVYAPYLDLVVGEEHHVPLFAFCRDVNIPDAERGLRFPAPGEVIFEKGPGEDLVNRTGDVPETTRAQLQKVFERATSARCLPNDLPSAKPLDLTSLATQFAVYVAYLRDSEVWKTFVEEANSTVFLRDYTGIYCLLDKPDPGIDAALSAAPPDGIAPLEVTFKLTSNKNSNTGQEPAAGIVKMTWTITKEGDPQPLLIREQREQTYAYRFESPGTYHVEVALEGVPLKRNEDGTLARRASQVHTLAIAVITQPIAPTPVPFMDTPIKTNFGNTVTLEQVLVGGVGVIVLIVLSFALFDVVRRRLLWIGIAAVVAIAVIALILSVIIGRS